MLASKTEETQTEYGSFELKCLDKDGIKCLCFMYFTGNTIVKFVFVYSDVKVVYSKYID